MTHRIIEADEAQGAAVGLLVGSDILEIRPDRRKSGYGQILRRAYGDGGSGRRTFCCQD